MTDREQAGLRGRVKTCATERDYQYPGRRWGMHTNDTFSLEGYLLQRRHRNPDGSQWSTIFRYDEQGRTLEKEHLSEDTGAGQLFSYLYDVLGRLDRIVLRSGKDDERVFESMQYATDGTKTRTSYPIALDGIKRQTAGVSAESMLHYSIDAVVITTVFDAGDHPIRKVLYDADDRVIRRVGFRYDTRGLLLEEGELVDGRIRDDFRNVYRYDTSGRQIEADKRWGDLGGCRRTFAYNDRGYIAREMIEQNTGIFSEADGTQSWTQRFAYQYDDRGNWTEQTTETILQNGEARISMIERRKPTYY